MRARLQRLYVLHGLGQQARISRLFVLRDPLPLPQLGTQRGVFGSQPLYLRGLLIQVTVRVAHLIAYHVIRLIIQ